MCPRHPRNPREIPRLLAVGRVLGSFGVSGWLKVEPLTDQPERFRQLKEIFLVKSLSETSPASFLIEEVKVTGGEVQIKMARIQNREEAAAYKGQLLAIPGDQALPLPAGRFYQFELIGLEIVTENGRKIGEVTEIWPLAGNPVIVAATPGGELLIPALKEFIKEVDLAGRKMVVKVIPGMLE